MILANASLGVIGSSVILCHFIPFYSVTSKPLKSLDRAYELRKRQNVGYITLYGLFCLYSKEQMQIVYIRICGYIHFIYRALWRIAIHWTESKWREKTLQIRPSSFISLFPPDIFPVGCIKWLVLAFSLRVFIT